MKRMSKREAALWRITRIAGSRAQELAELRAESAEAAIQRYTREFAVVDEALRKRLAAYRVIK